MHITIFTDGGARGNPGPAGAGAVILDEKGKVLKEISDYLGETTNNIAEYEALIRALRAAKELFSNNFSDLEITVKMDSELIVRQMNGLYKVKAPELKHRFIEALTIIKQAKHVSFAHVRRELNKNADRLVNRAIDRSLK